MSLFDGKDEGGDGWLSASGIATFVYCERKYRLGRNPPAGYSEPVAVRERKGSGSSYHRRKGAALLGRVAAQHLMLLASFLLVAVAVAIWFLY